jgi:hypothetical protein
MMKSYKVSIRGSKYSTEYEVEGGRWSTAAFRAVRAWEKTKGKGSRTDKLVVVLVPVGAKPVDWVPPEMPVRGKGKKKKVSRGLLKTDGGSHR